MSVKMRKCVFIFELFTRMNCKSIRVGSSHRKFCQKMSKVRVIESSELLKVIEINIFLSRKILRTIKYNKYNNKIKILFLNNAEPLLINAMIKRNIEEKKS